MEVMPCFKYILLTTITWVFLGLCYAQEGEDGYEEEYWHNGNLKSKGGYLAGIKNGPWEYYFIDGSIYQRGKYCVDTNPDTIIVVDPETLEEHIKVVKQEHPVKHDMWLEYDRDGTLLRETLYIRGMLVSDVKHF